MHSPFDHFHKQRGDEALAIVRAGLRVFPARPGEKLPAIVGWPEKATTDSAIVQRAWSDRDYNPCIATGAYRRIVNGVAVIRWLIVLDYDMKPGQLGRVALFEHRQEGWDSSVSITTATGGIHNVFWSDEPIRNSAGRVAANVDVRGERGYVLAATSVVNGGTYVRHGEYADIPDMPEGLKALIRSSSGSTTSGRLEHGKLPIGELDRPGAIALVKQDLINDAPEAIEGSGGDLTTFQVAARCKDLGVSEGVCLELMLNHWNEEKAFPPWAYDALRTKVSNAYRYGQSPPGSANARMEFGVDDENSGDNSSQDAQSTTQGSGIDARGRTPMVDETFDEAADAALNNQSDPLIEGIMGQGEMTGVYGNPESGKTFTVLDLAYAVASGPPTWNGRKVTQGAVLYVVAEGSKKIRARFRALRVKYGKANVPMLLLIYPMDMRTGRLDADRLSELVLRRGKEMGQPIRLVVLDTLTNMLAGGNDTEHMNQFLSNAQSVQVKTGAHVLAIHHPGKDVSKGPRGSSVFRGWVDTLIEVHDPSKKKGGRRRFEVVRVRDEELPSNPFWFRVDGTDLGTTPNGSKLTSATVTWLDSAEEDFRTEMTPAETTLLETVKRWSEATGAECGTVTAKLLLAWLDEHDQDNPIGQTKAGTLRMQLLRLREEGFMENTE